MIYVCENPKCQFIFKRLGNVDTCPDCASTCIRIAAASEIDEYKKRHKQLETMLYSGFTIQMVNGLRRPDTVNTAKEAG